MRVQLPPCAYFPLTAGVPCPNLREEGGLPVAKTTADLYKLVCVGGIELCRERSCLSLRSHPYSCARPTHYNADKMPSQLKQKKPSGMSMSSLHIEKVKKNTVTLIFYSQTVIQNIFQLQQRKADRSKYEVLREKALFLFKNWHCLCLTATLWNCSINPRCLFPRGKVKIFSNSFVLLIQQRIHVLHGRPGLEGANGCSRQQWINSYKWIVVHGNWQQQQRQASRTSDTHVHVHTVLWDRERSEVNRHAHTHSNTFFTSYKSSMSSTLERFINI